LLNFIQIYKIKKALPEPTGQSFKFQELFKYLQKPVGLSKLSEEIISVICDISVKLSCSREMQ